MTNPAASSVPSADDSDLLHLRRSFIRHLAADGRTPATRSAYAAAIVQLDAFLLERGSPTTVTELTSDHLEAFIVSLYERGMRPTTILARHHALSRFFGWLVAENERYLSARALHHSAHLPHLWLGRRGRLTDRGVDLAVRHRGRLAGLPALHAQRLRHTYVQQHLADGGSGRDLMRLVGWKSRQLLGRYRNTAVPERHPIEWLRLGDRL